MKKNNFTLEELRQEKIRRLKREQLRRSAQKSLKDFIIYLDNSYLMGWVHEEICDTLDQFYEDVKNKKSPRLIICMPPRSGKSQIISRNFPAYLFGRDPNLNIITASYSGDLSSRFNLDVQRIIDSDEYRSIFPNTLLGGKAYPQYKKTDSLFEIVNAKGSYRSAGVGGGLTGMGCDILIIDDPLKDRAEANSPTIRNKLMDWYKSTAYTRLSDGGGVIILQTRWHPIKDDTPVLTAKGWKKHGDLRVGDQVYGINGKLVTVTHITPPVWCDVQVETKQETIVCSSTHLWATQTRTDNNAVVKEAGELLGQKNRYLPKIAPLDFEKKSKLPIDPYWLGLWLGDGSKLEPMIRSSYKYQNHVRNTVYDISKVRTDKQGNLYVYYCNQGLRAKLAELNLLNNKHIPDIYLYSSVEDRLKLVAGLIDTDGDHSLNVLRFANSNLRLIKGLKFVLRSLGMKVNNSEIVNKEGSTTEIKGQSITRRMNCYRFSFTPTMEIPVKLDYKKCKVGKNKLRGVKFSNAPENLQGWGRCITTTAEDGLYLVGESLIPTHNTSDLAGQLIQAMHNDEDADKFKVIEYQAIAEHDEAHRKKGEALHPERFSLAKLLAIKNTIGAYEWSSLYQQHPVPKEGALFKLDNFKRYNEKSKPAQFDLMVGSWDMTFKDNKTNDFVVGQIWGRKGADFYLLDEFRGQWDFVKTLDIFVNVAEKYHNVNAWLVEDKANGSAIISTLKKHISGIKPITPKESKIARAEAISTYVESGNVYIPEQASYMNDLEFEIVNFPAVEHDDQIDSMTQALNYFREKAPIKISENNLKILRYGRYNRR